MTMPQNANHTNQTNVREGSPNAFAQIRTIGDETLLQLAGSWVEDSESDKAFAEMERIDVDVWQLESSRKLPDDNTTRNS